MLKSCQALLATTLETLMIVNEHDLQVTVLVQNNFESSKSRGLFEDIFIKPKVELVLNGTCALNKEMCIYIGHSPSLIMPGYKINLEKSAIIRESTPHDHAANPEEIERKKLFDMFRNSAMTTSHKPTLLIEDCLVN
ncbi:hypothetical protein RF11_14891 [Thelohanellus kitauei]|uniref:Uncharacterized protein n=1 Tax=Thelohanellus kitauei TaxID=669202 RepID=A0A0C2MNK1_THEKT|nr:hypothetical protein RF11_14891 [Thelohanellus kitauei]